VSDRRTECLSACLAALGARCVFGLPGTQNVGLFDELRTSSLRTVLATSELSASFMALGHARVTGRPGVLVTIPGPGFTYALPGLAEARLDSVPLLHVVVHKPLPPGRRFRHQEIEHLEIVRPLAKGIVEIRSREQLADGVGRAWREARAGEPGPVILWVSSGVFGGEVGKGRDEGAEGRQVSGLASLASLGALSARLAAARRPVFFLGLGAMGGADPVRRLVEQVGAPFFTTPSARGVIPEDHPLCLEFDPDRGGIGVLNELLDASDLVLALGCKLGHNGTGGFRLKLARDRLVHVNTDPEALGANYPASMLVRERVEAVAAGLLDALSRSGREGEPEVSDSAWSLEGVSLWRSRIAAAGAGGPPEPSVPGVPSRSVRGAIEILREELPRDAIVVTDSGLHQVMIRRHFRVLAPNGLVMPTDFQSMGFGLPAAIGAKLAAPERDVVAVVGDGGLAMSGMELLTLARERIPLTVLVFNDGYLNLIRLQQERDFGREHAVRLRNPAMDALAEACGVGYVRLDEDLRGGIRGAIAGGLPILAELPLAEAAEMPSIRRRARTKALARQALGDRLMERVKKLFGRDGPAS